MKKKREKEKKNGKDMEKKKYMSIKKRYRAGWGSFVANVSIM